MSVDTKAYLKGAIHDRKVMQVLHNKLGAVSVCSRVESKVQNIDDIGNWPHHHFGSVTDYVTRSGFIDFTMPNGDIRMVFYYYTNCWASSDDQSYIEDGLEKMVSSDRTYLSLGYWGDSVDIMKAIVEEFGGWLDENDCDDETYYYIRKKRSSGGKT